MKKIIIALVLIANVVTVKAQGTNHPQFNQSDMYQIWLKLDTLNYNTNPINVSELNQQVTQEHVEGFLSDLYDLTGSMNANVIGVENYCQGIEVNTGFTLTSCQNIDNNTLNTYQESILITSNTSGILASVNATNTRIDTLNAKTNLNKNYLIQCRDELINAEKANGMTVVSFITSNASSGTAIASSIAAENNYYAANPTKIIVNRSVNVTTLTTVLYQCLITLVVK